MLIGFVQGYEELKWGISNLNPSRNGPLGVMSIEQCSLNQESTVYGCEVIYPGHYGNASNFATLIKNWPLLRTEV